MLSRVAERIYWMARYIERTENAARLITVYNHLWLDLPNRVRLGWRPLIDITSSQNLFGQRYKTINEQNIVEFLVNDLDNPASILCSLSQARENMRTIRDIVSTEAWELVNDLYLYARENAKSGTSLNRMFEVLNQLIKHCQEITGLLAGTMSHDEAYDFVRLGRFLERADMSTRILDTGAVNILPYTGKEEYKTFINIHWMSVLKSLDAYHSFRRRIHPRVSGYGVVNYLLRDTAFPRTLMFCLNEMVNCLQRLPNHDEIKEKAINLQRKIKGQETNLLFQRDELHEFLDNLQIEIGSVHTSITNNWFVLIK